jgi:hypothetical protein
MTPHDVRRLKPRAARLLRALLLVALLDTSPLAAGSETLTGRVIGIADGDTITVLDDINRKYKVRLAGKIIPCFALWHKFRGRHTSSNALSLHLRNCMQLQNGLIRAQITESTQSAHPEHLAYAGRNPTFRSVTAPQSRPRYEGRRHVRDLRGGTTWTDDVVVHLVRRNQREATSWHSGSLGDINLFVHSTLPHPARTVS